MIESIKVTSLQNYPLLLLVVVDCHTWKESIQGVKLVKVNYNCIGKVKSLLF